MGNRLHIITSTFFPSQGGMETSVLRLAKLLSCQGNTTRVYVLRSLPKSNQTVQLLEGVEVVYISQATLNLVKDHCDPSNEKEEKDRYTYINLKQAIMNDVQLNPEHQHLLLSFFASSSGFVTQQIASELTIPHVASVRGSDLNVFSHVRNYHATLDYVFKNANYVITTAEEQKILVDKYYGRNGQIKTIHNSVVPFATLSSPGPHRARTHVVSDCGADLKKGIGVLLDSLIQLERAKTEIDLTICGKGTDIQWHRLEERLSIERFSHVKVDVRKMLLEDDFKALLCSCDIYVNPTVAEGCSNSRLLAYSLGIPVVTTRTGEVPDLKALDLLSDVHCFETNNSEHLFEVLSSALVKRTALGATHAHPKEALLSYLNPHRERDAWLDVIRLFTRKKDTVHRNRQQRILFFVHDGTGLGHLQRVSRIARELQGEFSCLILSGHRAMADIVPLTCEYVHIPSLDSLVERKSRYWGRKPFWEAPLKEVLSFRNALIDSTIFSFDPDAIFIDFLPLGKNDELKNAVVNHRSKKYFILRGVLDNPDNIRIDVLGGSSESALNNYFNSILVTSPQEIIDVAREYDFSDDLVSKMKYVGYVAPKYSPTEIALARLERGLAQADKWVVCSAGGGMLGEALVKECERIAHQYHELKFDIVLGPKSSWRWSKVSVQHYVEGNIRYHKSNSDLGLLHAAADICIHPGGYNSLVESLQGTAQVIVVPMQLRTNDEQFIHAQRLSVHFPQIHALGHINELTTVFDAVLRKPTHSPSDSRASFFGGVYNISHALKSDLLGWDDRQP